MTTIIDLPENVFCSIFSFLKHVPNFATLRLVCKHFDHYACKSMFETISVYGSSGEPPNDPAKWLTTKNGLKTSSDECARLTHLLNCLYTQRLPVALRRTRHLKIFASDLFRLNGQGPVRLAKFTSSLERDVGNAVQQLTLTLPAIIRTLVNLEKATLYLSSYEPDNFIKSVSKALLALPQLDTINVNFLGPKAYRAVPIINAQCLRTIKLSWPLSESDPILPLGSTQASLYHAILGLGVGGSNLKRLEVSAKHPQRPSFGQYRLPPLPQIEELTLKNVPIALDEEAILGMTRLRSLRLGGFDCFNCDPYAAIWSRLRIAGRKLKAVGVDVVGQALVNYLASYEGLEALVLKLGKDANDYCVKDLCERVLGYHTRTLKLLHIDLHHHSDFRITWFFEYWPQWVRTFSNLRIVKATTSMNLMSVFDASVFLDEIIEAVTRIPTLQKLIIRHMHEDNCRAAESVFANSVTAYAAKAISRPLPIAPSCLVVVENFEKLFRIVLDRGEGLYGSLKITEHEGSPQGGGLKDRIRADKFVSQ